MIEVLQSILQSIRLTLMCGFCTNATKYMFLVKEPLKLYLTGISSLSVP